MHRAGAVGIGLLVAGCGARSEALAPTPAAIALAPILPEGEVIAVTHHTEQRCDGVGGADTTHEIAWAHTITQGGPLGFEAVGWNGALLYVTQTATVPGGTVRFDSREVFASDPLHAAVAPAVAQRHRVVVAADGQIAVSGLAEVRAAVQQAPDHPLRRAILAAFADEAVRARVAAEVRPFGDRRTAAVGESWSGEAPLDLWGTPLTAPVTWTAGFEEGRATVRWRVELADVPLADGTRLPTFEREGLWSLGVDGLWPRRETRTAWTVGSAGLGGTRCTAVERVTTAPHAG